MTSRPTFSSQPPAAGQPAPRQRPATSPPPSRWRARANIYVAAGTYTSSGAEVIRLVYSVNLYGGWDGAASGPIVRDPQVHVSVLDGQDARRVIYVVGEQPLIDGFTITRGYAINNGGGIYVFDGLPSFRNNLITDNWGTTYGGALYTAGGGANVENNRIIANETEYGGTLIFGSGTQGEVHGNLFADNLADYGSAVHIDKASLSFTHNILRTNTGSVVEINRGTGVIVITNNLFYDNPSTSVRLQNEFECQRVPQHLCHLAEQRPGDQLQLIGDLHQQHCHPLRWGKPGQERHVDDPAARTTCSIGTAAIQTC